MDPQPQSLIGALAQAPAILMALAALVTAIAAAWGSFRNSSSIVDTKKAVEDGNAVAVQARDIAHGSHDLMNSRFDEWKRESNAAFDAATLKAAEATAKAVIAAIEEGKKLGRAELKAEQANIAEGVVAGRAEVSAGKAEVKPKGE